MNFPHAKPNRRIPMRVAGRRLWGVVVLAAANAAPVTGLSVATR